MWKRFLPFFLIVLMAPHAGAHQPRIVKSNFTEVLDPEVSQAFYGELQGQPAEFRIQSNAPFRLYVGLLVPNLLGVRRDISAEIFRVAAGKAERLGILDGDRYMWTPFFEKFAGDNYLWGPEFSAPDSKKGIVLKGREVPAGIYSIRIFNSGNRGKYSLVVGDVESFPPLEILRTVLLIPQIKRSFFEKSWWSSIFNRFTLVFAVFSLALIVLLTLLTRRIIRRFHRRSA